MEVAGRNAARQFPILCIYPEGWGLNAQDEIADLIARGNKAHARGDLALARDAFERARAASNQIGDVSLEMHALNGLGIVLLSEGHFEEAHDIFHQAAHFTPESVRVSSSHQNRSTERPNHTHTNTDQFWLDGVEMIEFSLNHARMLLRSGFIAAALDWCNRAHVLCGTLRSQPEIPDAGKEFNSTLQTVGRLINEVMSVLIELLRRK